jgi:autotransporter passenger strand-loop-strand repeat protein
MTTVSSGQTHSVTSNSETGDIVLFGGTLDVLAGGTIIDTVDSGGRIFVSAGGSAIDTTLVGVTSGNRLFTALEVVFSGGTANDTTVSFGGFQVVFGGYASDTTIEADFNIPPILCSAALDGVPLVQQPIPFLPPIRMLLPVSPAYPPHRDALNRRGLCLQECIPGRARRRACSGTLA